VAGKPSRRPRSREHKRSLSRPCGSLRTVQIRCKSAPQGQRIKYRSWRRDLACPSFSPNHPEPAALIVPASMWVITRGRVEPDALYAICTNGLCPRRASSQLLADAPRNPFQRTPGLGPKLRSPHRRRAGPRVLPSPQPRHRSQRSNSEPPGVTGGPSIGYPTNRVG
jgi:hypothetical protein